MWLRQVQLSISNPLYIMTAKKECLKQTMFGTNNIVWNKQWCLKQTVTVLPNHSIAWNYRMISLLIIPRDTRIGQTYNMQLWDDFSPCHSTKHLLLLPRDGHHLKAQSSEATTTATDEGSSRTLNRKKMNRVPNWRSDRLQIYKATCLGRILWIRLERRLTLRLHRWLQHWPENQQRQKNEFCGNNH